ncbi:hypothetical protein B0H34DRAFT_678658 [Crassisporium funariophilum]|nr:hypothetical protein B0H34DRAFT_678658 [Crassisporium funariophilum]
MGLYDETFGALLVGCMVSIWLFGGNTIQTWLYHRSKLYGKRGIMLRKKGTGAQVCPNWRFLELSHTCLAGWTVYASVITNFGNLKNAYTALYSILPISGVVSVTITSLVQWYFAFRLYKLSNITIIPAISVTLSIARLTCFTCASAQLWIHSYVTQRWKRCLFAVGIMSTCSDLLVAVGLFYILWKRRSDDRSRWWPNTIDQIIFISLQADAFTCLVTTFTLILYNVLDNFAWMAMSVVACRLFSISCLASIMSGRNVSRNQNSPNIEILMVPSALLLPPIVRWYRPDTWGVELSPGFGICGSGTTCLIL